ncbi:hypothetical protein JL193_09430 [Polaribacter batillariae]|uniref:Uncharacterized protein n=1 Tax=Polaribacter batillariae TaxID=2808900 RepID=A0ABX7SS72_9FLAO|nr:hypothetical protein [Polaribacter batillariae]QTD36381.1 hypothetical protein JL193_09430 [Polaribacter batillariae]
MVEDDFHKEGFIGIDGQKSQNKDQWKLSFLNLESYKNSWLQQAKEFHETAWEKDVRVLQFKILIVEK